MTLPKLRAPRCCPRQRKDRSGLALPEVSAGSALAGLRGMNNERLEVVLPHGRRDHPVQVPPVARWERRFLTKVKLLRVTGTYPPRYTQKIEFDRPPSTPRLRPTTEKRRVGNEGVSTGRSLGQREPKKKNK